MHITKLEHACLVIEGQGKKLVIDPGGLTAELADVGNVAAVVVTHDHFDHFNEKQLSRIIAANPNVQIFTTPEVSTHMSSYPCVVVAGGYEQTVGPFTVHFYGDMHALIHGDQPKTHNVGVLVNDTLYYPGDSFTVPDVAVRVLAVPVSGPWLKLGEAIDFAKAVKAPICFPTHDALHSDVGFKIANDRLTDVVAAYGGIYHPLKPGDTLEI